MKSWMADRRWRKAENGKICNRHPPSAIRSPYRLTVSFRVPADMPSSMISTV